MPEDVTRSKSLPETTLSGGNLTIIGKDSPFEIFSEWDRVHIQNTSSSSSITVYVNDDNDQVFNVSAGGSATWEQADIQNIVIEANGDINANELIVSFTKTKKSTVQKILGL